jgi:hypothetical protein
MSYIEFTFMYIEKALYNQSCGVTNHSYTIKRREIGKKTSPHISIIYTSAINNLTLHACLCVLYIFISSNIFID